MFSWFQSEYQYRNFRTLVVPLGTNAQNMIGFNPSTSIGISGHVIILRGTGYAALASFNPSTSIGISGPARSYDIKAGDDASEVVSIRVPVSEFPDLYVSSYIYGWCVFFVSIRVPVSEFPDNNKIKAFKSTIYYAENKRQL